MNNKRPPCSYKKKFRAVPILYLMGIFLFPSAFVFAKERTIEKLDELLDLPFEELFNISITSTSYFSETPLDVAASVNVISHQNWEKRGARRLDDALENQPSVVSLPNFLGQSSVRIRGYATDNARGVSTLWDGVPIDSFNLSTADVDRQNIQLNTLGSIEVTRGPGSALYGSDAFHGVVALNSYESDKNESRVIGRYGSNGFYSGSYNGTQNLSKDSRMSLSVASSGQPDQNISYDYTGGSAEREYNYQSSTVVAKFASKFNENWSYKIGFYYDDNDSNKFHGRGGQNPSPGRDLSSTNTDITMFKVDVAYKLSQYSDISLNSYSWVTNRFYEQATTGTLDIEITGKEHREAMQLLYRNKKFARTTELSVALETRHDKIDNQRRRVFNSTTTIVDAEFPFSGVGRRIDTFLADGKTHISDSNWIFRYGFRLDDYSDFGSQLTPRLGVIYQLNSQSVLKALYGQSFRAPNAVEVAGSAFIAGDPNIKPEELDTYELVYLRQTKDAKYEVTLFNNELTNGIAAVGGQFTNISKSESRGIELGYSKKMSKWLIESSGSYVDSTDTTNNQDYIAFPKYIINLGIGYDFSHDWVLYVNNRAMLDVHSGTNTNAPELKDYWRVDINLRKSIKKNLQVFANIRNALDRDNYRSSLVDQEGGIPEDGINIDIGAQYKF